MSKKKLLFVNFEPFSEKMYPHVYEVVSYLKIYFDLTYLDCDDKGVYTYRSEKTKSQIFLNIFKLGSLVKNIRNLFIYQRALRKIKIQTKKILNRDFDIVVVTHHSGLNYIAEYLSPKTKLIFWSLDILTPDYGWGDVFQYLKKILKDNRKFKNRIDLIIVQDENRASLLDLMINSYDIDKFFLPVSLSPVKMNTRRKRNLNNNTNLLQIGAIDTTRSSDELLYQSSLLSSTVNLTFLGDISGEIKQLIKTSKKHPTVYNIASTRTKMFEIIQKADIGIIGFKQNNLNNYFYSKASGQLVEFLRLGIPVIAIDAQELGQFINKEKIGLYLDRISNLHEAVVKIKSNYQQYQRNCTVTFDKYFNLDKYKFELIKRLVNL